MKIISMKKFKIITLIIIFVLIYINLFDILVILGNQFNKEIKYKNITIKRPDDLNLIEIGYGNKSNFKGYVFGLVEDKYLSLLLPIEAYKHYSSKDTVESNESYSGLNLDYIFNIFDYNYEKMYGFGTNNDKYVTLLFSSSDNLINDFNTVHNNLQQSGAEINKGKFSCKKNNSCIASGVMSNSDNKILREIIDKNHMVDTININNDIIIQVLYIRFNLSETKAFNKIAIKLYDEIRKY